MRYDTSCEKNEKRDENKMTTLSKRIDTLDYLRGFALLGIILVNIGAIISVQWPQTETDILYRKLLDFFVEGKFFTIFSTLFGIGFYIFINNAKKKEQNTYLLYLRRIIVLAIFGLLHMQLQPGEALLTYSIFGLILIIFSFLKKEVNLILGILLLGACLYFDVKIIAALSYFILGYVFAQYGLIYTFKTAKRKWQVVGVVSGIASVVAVIIMQSFYVLPHFELIEQTKEAYEKYPIQVNTYNHIVFMLSPVLTIFYTSLLISLLNTNMGQKVLTPLKYYGRMALTNYIGQTILIYLAGAFLFNGPVRLIHTLFLSIVIYLIQLIFTYFWLKAFRYGPLEYIWRCLTYLKIMPMR